MNRRFWIAVVLILPVVLAAPAFAQQQGQMTETQGAMGMPMMGMPMMCMPMMGGMMGGMGTDPKMMGRMMEMQGEMMMKMGEVMMKHGKMMPKGMTK